MLILLILTKPCQRLFLVLGPSDSTTGSQRSKDSAPQGAVPQLHDGLDEALL